MSNGKWPGQIRKGERFNVLTCFLGVVAMPVGVVALVATAVRQGDPWKIVSLGIYCLTLLSLYPIATLYHAMRGKTKLVLRELDHDAILFFIAGTYTPFSLVTLRGGWGWTLFGLVWGLAIYGVLQRRLPGILPRVPEMAVYLAMGWLVVIAARPLLRTFPLPGVVLLAVGGIFYTGGIYFYRLTRKFAWGHGVWHLCVLAGTISHYLAIFLYVA